jgi:hypothetical protein
MSRYKKYFASFLLVLSLIITPLPFVSTAASTDTVVEQNSPMAMTVDLVVCRPLGLIAMVGGTLIFFVVSSPLSVLGGNAEEACDSLVVSPTKYTLKRPLGEFD